MPEIEMIDWTDDAIKNFWTHTKFATEEYFTYVFGKAIVQKFSTILRPGSRVLDYGCGIGCLVEHLLKKEISVTAADSSPAAVDTVNKKFKSVGMFKGAFGIKDLLERNEQFDVIIAIEVVEHMSDLKLQEFFEHVQNLLSEKGLLVITTPNNEDLAKQYVYCPNCEHVFHRVQHVRSWTEATLRDYFESKGFHALSTYATDFSTMNLSFFARQILKIRRKLSSGKPHLVGIFSVKA